MLLEEKRIPYRVEKINMRSYGDKPQSFLRKGGAALHNIFSPKCGCVECVALASCSRCVAIDSFMHQYVVKHTF
jgi:hypothetical protein